MYHKMFRLSNYHSDEEVVKAFERDFFRHGSGGEDCICQNEIINDKKGVQYLVALP